MLENILAHKREEVAHSRRRVGLAEVRRRAEQAPAPRDLLPALRRRHVAVIAEIKRASPSRGPLATFLDASTQAQLYERGGAAAISVLTDARFFAGSLADLATASKASTLPVLRKDFVVDEYQVYEARAAGADAILLIAAALPDGALRDLLALAGGLGMRCLVETHDERELLRALRCGAGLLGINNRDLRSFVVDLTTTERLAPLAPPGCVLVAESGIRCRADVERVAGAGVDAVLVGEALVRAPDAAMAVGELGTVPRLARGVPRGRDA